MKAFLFVFQTTSCSFREQLVCNPKKISFKLDFKITCLIECKGEDVYGCRLIRIWKLFHCLSREIISNSKIRAGKWWQRAAELHFPSHFSFVNLCFFSTVALEPSNTVEENKAKRNEGFGGLFIRSASEVCKY